MSIWTYIFLIHCLVKMSCFINNIYMYIYIGMYVLKTEHFLIAIFIMIFTKFFSFIVHCRRFWFTLSMNSNPMSSALSTKSGHICMHPVSSRTYTFIIFHIVSNHGNGFRITPSKTGRGSYILDVVSDDDSSTTFESASWCASVSISSSMIAPWSRSCLVLIWWRLSRTNRIIPKITSNIQQRVQIHDAVLKNK